METGFNTLVSEEDNLEHATDFYSYQDKRKDYRYQKTYVSLCSPVAVGLTVLAVVLLLLNIGLGVYHSYLKDTHVSLEDVENIKNELKNLEETYKAAFNSTDNYKKQLDTNLRGQTQTKWEFEHQTRRNTDYQANVAKMTKDIAELKYRLPKIGLECRLCLPGWVWLNSMCYFFPLENYLGYKVWSKAREFCQMYGGDLAVLNSTDKENTTVVQLAQHLNQDSSEGFWIGLSNLAQEDSWKWVDTKLMVEGYWMDAEPSAVDGDACVSVHATENIYKAWRTSKCRGQAKKWICEKAQEKWG